MRDCHYKTSTIEYWGKGGTGIPLFVTACFDNSEFSEVVTLKSLGGIFVV